MSPYAGLHAAVYDEIYGNKPYANEARFVHELVGTTGGRLLDVACGTGRHALAFADLGYDVTGTDLNEELLAIAARAAHDRARFVVGDMRDLDIGDEPFDLVTCLFDSIGYAVDNEAVIGTLRSLGRHAATGGVVVCEFLHAPALLLALSPTRVRRWSLADGRSLLRISETTLDVERMVMEVRYELVALDGDAHAERAEEVQRNRCFSAPEMRLLAAAAGLRPRAIIPAYRNGTINAETFHLLLVASPAA